MVRPIVVACRGGSGGMQQGMVQVARDGAGDGLWATSWARRGGGSSMRQGVVRVARDRAGDVVVIDGPRQGHVGAAAAACGRVWCV